MENSILTSTKQILGIAADYTAFDLDILTHINSSLGVLNQLGVGSDAGITVIDATAVWDDLGVASASQLNLCRTYVYVKTRMLFDPPANKFHLTAFENQVTELEWRIHANADSTETLPVSEPTRPVPPGPDPNQEEWWALLP